SAGLGAPPQLAGCEQKEEGGCSGRKKWEREASSGKKKLVEQDAADERQHEPDKQSVELGHEEASCRQLWATDRAGVQSGSSGALVLPYGIEQRSIATSTRLSIERARL